MYDFASADENMKHYNQTTPPVYDITKVKVPVALYWAQNDYLADPTDVQFLRGNLPNIVDDFNIATYNHLDFVWAYNTKEKFYDRMVALMEKYI
jgi:lysosomal acid lipase/cholesteryl ester hydrolase